MRQHLWMTLVLLSGLPYTWAYAQSSAGLVNVASRRKDAVVAARADSVLLMARFDPVDLKAVGQALGSPGEPTALGRHPYVGAQVGYAFGDGSFASNAVTSGSAIYSIIGGDRKANTYQFFLPVRGNIGAIETPLSAEGTDRLTKLVGTPGGLGIAVEPYVLLPDAGNYLHPSVFASAGWSLRTAKDATDSTRYLPQGRVAAGFSVGIGPSSGETHPLFVELSRVYTEFVNDDFRKILGAEAKARAWATQATVILPLSAKTAFLTEVVSVRGSRSIWRMGMILMGGNG